MRLYRILLATDGSEHSQKAVEEALVIAEAVKAEVTVVTVLSEESFNKRATPEVSEEIWNRIESYLTEEGESIVKEAAKPFRDKGLTVKTEVLTGKRSPAEAICEIANDYSLLVVGSHGLKGIREALLGSVSNKLAHCAKTSVLIVK